MSLDLVDQQTRIPNMCFKQRRSAESGRIPRGLLRLLPVEQLLNNTCEQGRESGQAVVVEEGASPFEYRRIAFFTNSPFIHAS